MQIPSSVLGFFVKTETWKKKKIPAAPALKKRIKVHDSPDDTAQNHDKNAKPREDKQAKYSNLFHAVFILLKSCHITTFSSPINMD